MSGSILTGVMQAVVKASVREIDGKTVSRPSLIVSDSLARLTYGVDVDIGQTRADPNTGEQVAAILKNVPLATGDQSIRFADVGAAVRLRRYESGNWEVIGFAKRAPGTMFRMGITLGELGPEPVEVTESTPVDISLSTRLLSYDELATFGGYGVVPYGAYGVFRAGELVEVHA